MDNSEVDSQDCSDMDECEDTKIDASEVTNSMDDYEGSSELSSTDETVTIGNFGWADAMQKVLKTKIKTEKKFILSKAKKDSECNKQKKEELEVVDETGKVIKEDNLSQTDEKSYKDKHAEVLKKHQQKLSWEALGRVKPNILNREKERELTRIATRGVVHLFNTVEKHQQTVKKNPKEKKKQKLGNIKGNFMDILKSHSRMDRKTEPVIKVEQEDTWNIFKDDLMMGAEMKDWDKESDIEK